MTPNCNYSSLPWYVPTSTTAAIDFQDVRRAVGRKCDYPLFSPLGWFPPFLIVLPATGVTENATFIVRAAETHAEVARFAEDDTAVVSAGMTRTRYDNFVVLSFASYSPMVDRNSLRIHQGQFYLETDFGFGTCCSEVFTFIGGSTTDLIMLEWGSTEDLLFNGGAVPYSTGYRNRLWLPTAIGNPEYESDSEGQERDARFYPTKLLSNKTYRFGIPAPQYLCDVMRTIPVAERIGITNFGQYYDISSFEVDSPSWYESTGLASIVCSFNADTVIKSIGNGRFGENGDYNDDYNDDYNVIINQ